jgi:hypothetical protein
MKPNLSLNLGRETSDKEVEEILDSFSPFFEVKYERNLVRLSADLLPLIIDFAVSAIGGGLLYDSLKGALISIQEKFRSKKLGRSPAVQIRVKNKTYIISEDKITFQSIDIELSFKSVEEFLNYLNEQCD